MKKYKQLFKQLERDILIEKYQLGDFLPSEHQLMEIYQVSRDTVRKALALLQEEGLIEKVRGQGSKVVKQEQLDFPVSNLTSYQELVAQHQLQSKTNVISLDKITVDKKLSKQPAFQSTAWFGVLSGSEWSTTLLLSWILTIWIKAWCQI